MKMLFAPLPDWKIILKSFFSKNPCTEEIVKFWLKNENQGILYSRSAWSLAAIALWRKLKNKQDEVNIWVPDYFCNSSLRPVRSIGANITFYPINEDREPDFTACKTLMKEKSIDIFMIVHYFGKPADVTQAYNFCYGKGIWLVEDAAHVIKPINGIGEKGDFVLYSPHKHLPIPDGAVLVINKKGVSALDVSASDRIEIENICLKSFKDRNNHFIKNAIWLIKRIIQKIGVRPVSDNKIPFLMDTSCLKLEFPEISKLSKRMLINLLPSINHILRQRIRNKLLLDDYISSFNKKDIKIKNLDRDWNPYLAEYLISESVIEELYSDLIQKGLPVSSWPDLPTEIYTKPGDHEEAIKLRKSRLFIAVHQSLITKQICHLFEGNKLQHNEFKVFALIWNALGRDDWDNLLKKSSRSNLLQTWVYGEGKNTSEGWQVQRGVFYHNSEVIAIVQVLKKRLFVFFDIYRINRGPLIINNITEIQLNYILKEISKLGNIWKLKILFFNPDFNLNGRSFFKFRYPRCIFKINPPKV